MKRLNNKGFTLVELIIVIAILAIIMLIAIPNFSGIQQRMQVRADKATAAQIGKAVRIWYTEYQSDPAMKIDVGSTVGIAGGAAGKLPDAGEKMIPIDAVKSLGNYLDTSLQPSSLLNANKVKETNQYYLVGLTGTGTAEKIVVAINNSNSDANLKTLATTAQTDIKYDGVNMASDDTDAYRQSRFAYLEP